MNIFVNNVDGHLAGAICADLSKLSRNIIGTRKGQIDEYVPPPPVIKKVIDRVEVRKLLKTIAACDVVIYDLHDADLEELELVLRILYQSEITQDLTFILISSVGVWARTQREYEPTPEPAHEETPGPDANPEEEGAAAEAPEAAAEAGSGGGGGEGGGEVGEPLEALRAASKESAAKARQVKPLRSEDYVRRIPAPKFQEWRTIETLTLSLKEKGVIRPYVVCAGMPYGNGEDAFLGLFRAAWMSRPTLRVIGPGHNALPLVHVRDCARLVRRVLEEKPELDYHLAVDRGDATQRQVVEAVAAEFGIPYEIKSVSVPEAILAELADMLTMDIRLEPSDLMTAAALPSSEDAAPDGAAAAPSGTGASQPPPPPLEAVAAEAGGGALAAVPPPGGFRWWCEGGLPANIATVGAEFRRWRRLAPVRFCVAGTMGSSTAELGQLLAARYNLPHIVFDDLIEELRSADTATGQLVRDKLGEIEAAFANPKSTGPFVLPASVSVKVIEEAVSTKPCEYRGFVLSGFPQSVEEATEFFCEDKPLDPEVAAELAAAAKDAKKGKKDKEEVPTTEKVPRERFLLDGAAIVQCPEDAALLRLKAGEQPEEQWMPSFKRRLERWNKENPEGGPGLADFFRGKLGVEPAVAAEPPAPPEPPADGSTPPPAPAAEDGGDPAPAMSVAEVMEAAAVEVTSGVEAARQINNFMPAPPGPQEAEQKDAAKEEAPAREEASLRREEEELRKKREKEEKLEQIKRDELVRLEKHSEPLRQYLMGFVVPTITTGLVEVCRQQPEDPVGYLAEYLSVYSQLSRKRRSGSATASRRESSASSPLVGGGGGGGGSPAAAAYAAAPPLPVVAAPPGGGAA